MLFLLQSFRLGFLPPVFKLVRHVLAVGSLAGFVPELPLMLMFVFPEN